MVRTSRRGSYAFFAGEDHGRCEKAKRTRRYLLGHRRILKKGRLYHTPANPIFQKENGGLKCNISKPPFCAARPNSTVLLCLPAQLLPKRKEPINRLPIGYGLSALRLCVWLFYNRNIQILCGNKCFLLTLRTIQRKIYEYCISSDF